MKLKTLIIILLSVLCKYSNGQSPTEKVKKSIHTYLYQNLNDFKNYEPIGYSDIQKVFSTIEGDFEYQRYSSFIDSVNIKQIELASKIESSKKTVENHEKEQASLNSELKKFKEQQQVLVNTDSIYSIEQKKLMKQEIEDLKQGKPIPGKEYLRDAPKSTWKKIEDPIREVEIANRERKLEWDSTHTNNTHIPTEYDKWNNYYKQQIQLSQDRKELIDSELSKASQERKEAEAKYLDNKNKLALANNKVTEIKTNFKSIQTGYYMCHRFRAKNLLGASVNSVKCFVTDNAYNILNVKDGQ